MIIEKITRNAQWSIERYFCKLAHTKTNLMIPRYHAEDQSWRNALSDKGLKISRHRHVSFYDTTNLICETFRIRIQYFIRTAIWEIATTSLITLYAQENYININTKYNPALGKVRSANNWSKCICYII